MILCIIQARCNSSRLPGKVLLPILGKPMLLHQVERVRRSKLVDEVLVITSTEDSDQPIRQLCKNNNIKFFVGSLNDVLDRTYQAAKAIDIVDFRLSGDVIIRTTGDCPLIDPCIIDNLIERFLALKEIDYLGNTTVGTTGWPDGMDVEIFTFEALKKTWEEAVAFDREHVTSYMYQSGNFRCFGPLFYRKPLGVKLSVDTPEDFARVSKIFEALYPTNPEFGLKEIIEYLEEHNG